MGTDGVAGGGEAGSNGGIMTGGAGFDGGGGGPTDSGVEAGEGGRDTEAGGAGGMAPPTEVDGRAGAAGSKVDAGSGCPTGVVLKGQVATAQYGDDASGVLYADTCPQDEVVIGYTGAIDTTEPASIGRIRTRCGTLMVNEADSCSITVSPGAMLPERGDVGDVLFAQMCPANQVVVDFQGRSSQYLDQVQFTCASLVLKAGAAGYQVSIGPTMTLPAAGGAGGMSFEDGCPAGQIARGNNTDIAGGIVVAFGLICGTPTRMP